MSNDKTASLDILAEAFLPSDLLTPTLGSNYGMDGYPDMEYGMGTLTGILDQDAQEAPALPTGLQKGAAGEMALGELMADESLADLDWLDPDQPQDPDRLPENPVALSIPELVEAWGVHRRTDGVHRTDLAHARAASDAAPPKKRANARTIEKVVTHAMRRSVEGQHIERIVREAAESMGTEMERVVPLLRRVAADHGLAGNVFIRASAYPGWGSGKGKAHAKKYAKQAQYIIVSERDMAQATWIQNGRCAYTGKKAVTVIPWREAYRYYMPRLTATGRKVAAGSMKNTLREAFLSQPRKADVDTGYLPTHETPDQRISRQAAQTAFGTYAPERKVYENTRDHERRLAKAKVRLARMERDSLIPVGEADRILASGVDPVTMLRHAALAAKRVEHATYVSHVPSDAQATMLAHRSSRRQASQVVHGQRIKSAADNKAIAQVRNLLDRNLTTEGRVRQLLATHKSIQTVADIVGRESAQSFSAKRGYDGMVFKAASLNTADHMTLSDEGRAISKAASEGGVPVGEIRSILRGARRAMSEGFAGNDLTSYLNNRYSNRLISASLALVADLRSTHEGASGHLYVDAEAYASPTGSAGCEKAATKHRANQIPSVASMDRCATCTLVRTREDGTRKCGAYNKSLLDDTTGNGIDRIKAANIAGADMSDAEVTASYFAPTYDPGEFNLVNANLEDVALSDLPETEKLSNIMFGGWDIA